MKRLKLFSVKELKKLKLFLNHRKKICSLISLPALFNLDHDDKKNVFVKYAFTLIYLCNLKV